jgi:alanyl-tRNA synthetase
MDTNELREKYLQFFVAQGHSRQASDVLVPTWDPSVLFTPAGMNQFKDHFLGKVKLEFTRATTCQKCLRTGDIDNVGRTPYHHTFFEMLGNFSFGDYFKNEAIQWAWEFLTSQRWLGLDRQRLSVTVYKDDQEAADIWHEKIGLPTVKISFMEEDENFWPASAPSQGPDGVCGPCSEIYFQLDSGKSVEIWNLVFTQFNRVGDPPNNLRPLPSKNIDTGMGLERTASVLQRAPTNFHIDLLFPIVQAAAEVCGTSYQLDSDHGRRLRRIADHVRACSMAVHENVYPGANGAKYVVRRLLRRAVLDGHQMGLRQPFLFQLVPIVAKMMGAAYPELRDTTDRVGSVIQAEERNFFETIDAGLERIQKIFTTMKNSGKMIVSGEEAADLYQTSGVPPELFQTLAAEHNYSFDWPGFKAAMIRHGEISGGKQIELFQTGPLETLKEALRETPFLGYEQPAIETTVRGIITGDGEGGDHGQLMSHVVADGQQILRIVLDSTPFYGESGGQVGDSGRIYNQEFEFTVRDTQKRAGLIVHAGSLVRGALRDGMRVTAEVDPHRRQAIRRAHSATHILHYALHKNVGKHAQQQGSKVDADWLRFDFTNQSPLDDGVLSQVEADVWDRVCAKAPIRWETISLAQARQAGAMMLFGEKYPDPVRMVSMGDFSRELCGGTHLSNTSEVESFELVSEESVSAGTRRIVALTGSKAQEHRQKVEQSIARLTSLLQCSAEQLVDRSGALMDEVRQLKKRVLSGKQASVESLPSAKEAPGSNRKVPYEVARRQLRDVARRLNVGLFDACSRIEHLQGEALQLRQQAAEGTSSASLSADQLLAAGVMHGGVLVVVSEAPGANPNLLRTLIDQIRQQSTQPTAVFLATASADDKVLLVAGLGRDLVSKGLSAGEWVSVGAKIVGGGGGGRADMAQAGGKDPQKIPEALAAARQYIHDALVSV